MKPLAIVATTIATAGCVVVPAAHETTTVATVATKLTIDPVGPSELTAALHGATITGTADWHRDCWRANDLVRQTTRTREPKVEIIIDQLAGFGDLLALALTAPISGVVSGAVTAIVVAASHPKTTRTTDHDLRLIPCAVAAVHEPVVATLPSGATVAGITDFGGRFTLALPADAPTGVITVSAIGTTLALESSAPGR